MRSDRVLLRRVLQNLISNALRYTRAGGVLVGCRRRGDSVELCVWDTGPGIPESQQRAIFDEFRRLDRPSPWGEQGLGLGLSICDRIARLLGHATRPALAARARLGVPRARAARQRGGPEVVTPVGAATGHRAIDAWSA